MQLQVLNLESILQPRLVQDRILSLKLLSKFCTKPLSSTPNAKNEL